MKHPKLRGLYAITDEQLIPADGFVDAVRQALAGGARIIQYRDKSNDNAKRLLQASAIRELCNEHESLLIINDDIELAAKTAAHGVHLGLEDSSITDARQQLGEQAIIGVSCYNRFELAEQAKAQGADYIAFGAFYASPTKPDAVTADIDLLKQARTLELPICAIGGITSDNANPLIQAGADMLAVISNVFAAKDITQSTREFSQLWR